MTNSVTYEPQNPRGGVIERGNDGCGAEEFSFVRLYQLLGRAPMGVEVGAYCEHLAHAKMTIHTLGSALNEHPRTTSARLCYFKEMGHLQNEASLTCARESVTTRRGRYPGLWSMTPHGQKSFRSLRTLIHEIVPPNVDSGARLQFLSALQTAMPISFTLAACCEALGKTPSRSTELIQLFGGHRKNINRNLDRCMALGYATPTRLQTLNGPGKPGFIWHISPKGEKVLRTCRVLVEHLSEQFSRRKKGYPDLAVFSAQ